MVFHGLRTLDDADVKGKRVFLRVDYNVPLDKDGGIVDDYRIRQSLPTIKKLFSMGASQIILASHLGRPKGVDDAFKMNGVAERLMKLSGRSVDVMEGWDHVSEFIPGADEASIVLLDNLRFHGGEESDDEGFARELAALADFYVNDAFAVCHRKHASVHAITRFLPGCVGLLVEREVKVFDSLAEGGERPFIAVLGGAKLETKIPVIKRLLDRVDHLLLGGGMIFTFYKAKGLGVGKSIVDNDFVDMARMLGHNEKVVLPGDVVIADDRDNPAHALNVTIDKIPSYMFGLDIGKESVERFKGLLGSAKLVVWNGPLGYYENPRFAEATNDLLGFLAGHPGVKTVIGGGDTVAIVEKLGLRDKFFHVSTGGGASMALLEGRDLPGIEALRAGIEK